MDSLTEHFFAAMQNGGQDEDIQYDGAQWAIFQIDDDDRKECTLAPATTHVALNPDMTIDGVGSGFWQAYEYTESDMNDFRVEADRQFDAELEHELQSSCDHLVRNEVIVCDSGLIDDLLRDDLLGFCWDDVENLTSPTDDSDLACEYSDEYEAYTTDNQGCDDFHEYLIEVECLDESDIQQDNEIFEWWQVTRWLAERLSENSQPILDNDYGLWWGRCTTGQAIKMDHVIRVITKELHATV